MSHPLQSCEVMRIMKYMWNCANKCRTSKKVKEIQESDNKQSTQSSWQYQNLYNLQLCRWPETFKDYGMDRALRPDICTNIKIISTTMNRQMKQIGLLGRRSWSQAQIQWSYGHNTKQVWQQVCCHVFTRFAQFVHMTSNIVINPCSGRPEGLIGGSEWAEPPPG